MMRWLRNDFTTLLLRTAMLYAAFFVARVIFYINNADGIDTIASGEIWPLFKGSLVFDTVSILYVNALFIVLSLLPWKLRERGWYQKGLFWIYIVTNAVALAVNMSDSVYFHYTRKRFSAMEIFFADNDNSLLLMSKFAAENWWQVLCWAGIVALLVWGWRRIGYRRTEVRNIWAFLGVSAAMLCFAGLSIVAGIRGGLSRSVRPITLSNAMLYTTSTSQANLILSNPFCIIRTMGRQGGIPVLTYFSKEEADAIFSPEHFPSGKPLHNLGDRNIVVFVLESFSREHSAFLNPDIYPDGKGYTPFLDSLMREGYTFASAFANGHKSIDALPSIFSSMPSFQTPFILLPQSLAPMKALPEILYEKGYATSFFCGSERGSMGFGAYANKAGIKELYSREDYEKVHGRGDADGFWGIWDEPFLGFMAETLGGVPQPFFSSVFTLSSHHPFVVPDKYMGVLPEGKTKVQRGIAYTDAALRGFFEKARGSEWFRNTIFVFVADHVSSEIYAARTRNSVGRQEILCFMYTPDGTLRGLHTGVAQQTDLMPTLLGLTGNDKPYFAFGRDVFNEPERRPLSVSYNAGGIYQGITDSLVVMFDGQRAAGVFDRADTMLRHDLSPQMPPQADSVLREMKAMIQQYTHRVDKADFLVRSAQDSVAGR